MTKKRQKTLAALRKAKEAVNQANAALDSVIQELDDDTLNEIAGGGEFDAVPTVVEHPYDPNDRPRY